MQSNKIATNNTLSLCAYGDVLYLAYNNEDINEGAESLRYTQYELKNRLVEQIAPLTNDILAGDKPSKIYCTSGPGSFTTLRVVLSFLKAIAFASACPIYSISSLKLLDFVARRELRSTTSNAPTPSSSSTSSSQIVSLIDARRNKLYSLVSSESSLILPESDLSIDELLGKVSIPCVFASVEASTLDKLGDELGRRGTTGGCRFLELRENMAKELLSYPFKDSDLLGDSSGPLYVRDSDAKKIGG